MLYKDFLATMSGCPFCDGRNGIIKDNPNAFLTYSIAPYHKHHMLVIPKRHVLDFNDLKSEEMSDIIALQKTAQELLNKLGYKDYSILVRFGDNSGKSVEHTHFHVVPDIRMGDVDHTGQDREVLSEEEIAVLMSEFLEVV